MLSQKKIAEISNIVYMRKTMVPMIFYLLDHETVFVFSINVSAPQMEALISQKYFFFGLKIIFHSTSNIITKQKSSKISVMRTVSHGDAIQQCIDKIVFFVLFWMKYESAKFDEWVFIWKVTLLLMCMFILLNGHNR